MEFYRNLIDSQTKCSPMDFFESECDGFVEPNTYFEILVHSNKKDINIPQNHIDDFVSENESALQGSGKNNKKQDLFLQGLGLGRLGGSITCPDQMKIKVSVANRIDMGTHPGNRRPFSASLPLLHHSFFVKDPLEKARSLEKVLEYEFPWPSSDLKMQVLQSNPQIWDKTATHMSWTDKLPAHQSQMKMIQKAKEKARQNKDRKRKELMVLNSMTTNEKMGCITQLKMKMKVNLDHNLKQILCPDCNEGFKLEFNGVKVGGGECKVCHPQENQQHEDKMLQLKVTEPSPVNTPIKYQVNLKNGPPITIDLISSDEEEEQQQENPDDGVQHDEPKTMIPILVASNAPRNVARNGYNRARLMQPAPQDRQSQKAYQKVTNEFQSRMRPQGSGSVRSSCNRIMSPVNSFDTKPPAFTDLQPTRPNNTHFNHFNGNRTVPPSPLRQGLVQNPPPSPSPSSSSSRSNCYPPESSSVDEFSEGIHETHETPYEYELPYEQEPLPYEHHAQNGYSTFYQPYERNLTITPDIDDDEFH